ncbi:MAG: hypothetical protein QME12_04590 [Nanoarchaeota archaeon]|nr:hypothetical protein [Nanoarchaeota archaeon]
MTKTNKGEQQSFVKNIIAITLSLRSSVRRRYLYYFKREYVNKMVKTRKGSCEGCNGLCCIKTRRCPLLNEGKCKLYSTNKMPFFCMVFPVDEKDIELAGVEDCCQFYWEKE